MRIKKIRNIKDTFDNILFISVILTVGSVFAMVLYMICQIAWATLFTANLLLLCIVIDILSLTASQMCDIIIWKIKMERKHKKLQHEAKTRMANTKRHTVQSKKRVVTR